MTCPYCRGAVEFLPSSAELYRGRDYGPVYLCRPCQAWVGCHPGTTTPLGRLANLELRRAKQQAHDWFDAIWKNGRVRRSTAYRWLAAQMGLTSEQCHIGKFDVAQCQEVVRHCKTLLNAKDATPHDQDRSAMEPRRAAAAGHPAPAHPRVPTL